MASPADQVIFKLDIAKFAEPFQVVEFRATEVLNQPYEVKLELVSERCDLDLESLLHRSAFLSFGPDGSGLHGQVYRVVQGDSGKRLTRYSLTLKPRLAYLQHRRNQRIFQHLSVAQIIAQLLAEHGMTADLWRFHLSAQYPARPYCVQFEESDLTFIQRLCEEEGLHFHFQHSATAHVLVFGDDQTFFSKLSTPTMYAPGSGLLADEPVIERFEVSFNTHTTHVSRRDYNFEKPSVLLEGDARSPLLPRLEDYAFPGPFTDGERGKQLTRRALERHQLDYRQAEGRSDQRLMRSGIFLDLCDHPRGDYNGLWLITQITHLGRQPQVLEEALTKAPVDDEFVQGYRNDFIASPWDAIFRPALAHPKPRIAGPQSAVVTGPPGEEIYCDAYGRVKVHLHWDRDGQLDEKSSCWLRVATGWAHDRYGTVLVPRVGMEVLVGFTQGDPDKPFIMGCLPNAGTPVPLDLPAQKTASVLRSQSTPGGGGYNELRIEDRQGAEQIALRAQRDFVQWVLNDERVQVDNARSVVVGGTASHELRGDEHHLTHGQRLTEIKQHDHLLVHGDQHIRSTNQLLSASRHFHLSADVQVVIDGAGRTTITGGGQWLTLGPEGIFSSVAIQQGGAPALCLRAEPLMPGVLPQLKLTFDPVQQRHALISNRASRCLICEEARP